jgi:hypothetical protein
VTLDLDAGWLRFYLNDKRCGQGFTEGVQRRSTIYDMPVRTTRWRCCCGGACGKSVIS